MNENDNYYGDTDRHKIIYLHDDAIDEDDDDENDGEEFNISFDKVFRVFS